ncbi:SDR family oxidoreductase [Herbidospora galbida]|uniref:SDR family oxidoreductase n=1 Tax=Herbidospora galbida TaxID=2575442 RepID=A0A4U3MHZ6_9ACTN|nr:SDR family oxidoreductase [Herbidospora galbida]TKK87536.1 SDR family oxidoreductase [Herbidospora galbida]
MTTALITGANKGIGFETARLLAERGVDVVIGARDPGRGEEAAARLGVGCVRLDVTSPETITAAAAFLAERFGSLDILVNNAGIAQGGPPTETPLDLMRGLYEVNVFGVVAVTNAMVPLLLKSPAGRIVMVSSEVGSLTVTTDPANPWGDLNSLAYQSSKTALNMVTALYAKELAGTAIKVNAISPGYCATDLNGFQGDRTAAQGAAVSVSMALLGDDGPTGTFVNEAGVVAW